MHVTVFIDRRNSEEGYNHSYRICKYDIGNSLIHQWLDACKSIIEESLWIEGNDNHMRTPSFQDGFEGVQWLLIQENNRNINADVQ